MTLRELRPVYVLVGDEVYFRDRFRAEVLAAVPPDARDFSVFEEDLAATPLDEILDRARNPSLMAPLQIFFVRGVKELFSRGSTAGLAAPAKDEKDDTEPAPAKKSGGKKKHGDFPDNVARFAAGSESPVSAVVIFIADHLHLPADRIRTSLEDKGRLQRIEATLGTCATLVQCGRAPAAQAVVAVREMAAGLGAELAPDAAKYLVELLEANLGMARRELEKLALHAQGRGPITVAAVQAMVAAAQLGSAYELAVQVAKRNRAASLGCLRRIWAEEGEGQAIGLVFQLSRALKMALLARQARVTDTRGMYGVLPEGLRPPGFAAEAIVAISRNMAEPQLKQGLQLLARADIELRSSPPSVRLVFEQFVFALT